MKTNFDIQKIPLVTKLMIFIAFCSLISMLLSVVDYETNQWVLKQFALFSDWKVMGFRLWQVLTYSFLHAGILHLLFNLLMLYFFSGLFFTYFNQKQFLNAYFLGAIAAGLFYIINSYLMGQHHYVVGASGAVMAVLFTVVGYNPKMSIHLMIFGRVTLWVIALVLIGFDLIQLFSDNSGGHLAHLGGSLFGFLYGNYLKGSLFNFLPRFKLKQKKKAPLRKIRNAGTTSKITKSDEVQKRIDVILDKISKSGYDSLSQDEKEFLFKQK